MKLPEHFDEAHARADLLKGAHDRLSSVMFLARTRCEDVTKDSAKHALSQIKAARNHLDEAETYARHIIALRDAK